MTTSTSSNRGARRRTGGRHSGADRSPRTPEQGFPVRPEATPSTPVTPLAPIDYITDFVALGVPAPLIKALADREVFTA
ncbi:MAG: hypothetical protein ABIZ69_01890, partial [Ilumatobacteraceae bacterium]